MKKARIGCKKFPKLVLRDLIVAAQFFFFTTAICPYVSLFEHSITIMTRCTPESLFCFFVCLSPPAPGQFLPSSGAIKPVPVQRGERWFFPNLAYLAAWPQAKVGVQRQHLGAGNQHVFLKRECKVIYAFPAAVSLFATVQVRLGNVSASTHLCIYSSLIQAGSPPVWQILTNSSPHCLWHLHQKLLLFWFLFFV